MSKLNIRRMLVVCLILGNVVGVAFLATPLLTQNPSVAAPQSYYVSAGPDGNDGNDGLSPTRPFKHPQKAANLTNPGDTVYLMAGTYTDQDGSGILTIKRSGTASDYITYRNYPGHQPVLHATQTWNHISVDGSAYIRIEGLEIIGNSDNITYDYAYSQKDIANPATNTNGIYMTLDYATGTKVPHHIEIRNNIVSKCPGAGIASKQADYLTIEDNVVHSTSWKTRYGTSGISLLNSVDIDSNTGYKNFIRRNISYDNQIYIPFYKDNRITDGNGIIIDSNKNQSTIGLPDYQGKTLVENNLVYNNGGSGIHAFQSAHVNIVNNTAYQNNRSPEINQGDIYANYSNDVNLLNNVSYARSGKRTNINPSNTNVVYDYNVYFNGTTPAVQGSHDLIANPLFVNIAAGDFRLQPSSPAIDTGTSSLAPPNDFNSIPKPVGTADDRGAFEFVPSPTVVQSLSSSAIETDGLTTLTLSLSNATPASLSAVTFSETLPSQVVIASPSNLNNTCGGSPTITATSGSSFLSVTALALSPNQTCAISLKLTSDTVGVYNFFASPVASAQTYLGSISNSLSLSVVVADFQASPLFDDNLFRVGAARVGSTKTAALKLGNVGSTASQLSLSYPTLSGPNANRFAIANPAADFPLSLAGGNNYNLNISCSPTAIGALSATLNFNISGAGISSYSRSITLSCNGAYAVTKPVDDGSPETLSYTLKNVATQPGDGVVFELGSATTISLTTGVLLPLRVLPSVTMDVSCSNPLTIIGSNGSGSSLTLQGNNYLAGLILQNMRLVETGNGNQLRCTKVEVAP